MKEILMISDDLIFAGSLAGFIKTTVSGVESVYKEVQKDDTSAIALVQKYDPDIIIIFGKLQSAQKRLRMIEELADTGVKVIFGSSDNFMKSMATSGNSDCIACNREQIIEKLNSIINAHSIKNK